MQAIVLERSEPRVRIVDLVWTLLLAFNLVEFALAWLRVLYGWLWSPLNLPPTPPIVLLDPPSPRAVLSTLLTAHIGLFVAVYSARTIAYLAPRITVKYDGLLMQSTFGQKFISDDALRGLRSIELPNERFIVWVDATKGLPLHNALAPLLFGRWAWRGFLLTSHSEHFDDAVAHGQRPAAPDLSLPLLKGTGNRAIADYRGEVVPVIDLRIRFGLPAVPATRRTKWIVVEVQARFIALVVAAGSNFPNRAEIPPDLVARAQTVVVDQLAAARLESGDLMAAHQAAKFDWERTVELGAVLAGRWKRPEAPGITLFESHGLALWDLAAGSTVVAAARERGMAEEVDLL